MWSKIRDSVRAITKILDDYNGKFIKMKFRSDNELAINKAIEIPTMTIALELFFMKIKNIIRSFFLGECLFRI